MTMAAVSECRKTGHNTSKSLNSSNTNHVKNYTPTIIHQFPHVCDKTA